MFSLLLDFEGFFFLRLSTSLFQILLGDFKGLSASVDFIICRLPEDITGAEKWEIHSVNSFWTNGLIMLKPYS